MSLLLKGGGIGSWGLPRDREEGNPKKKKNLIIVCTAVLEPPAAAAATVGDRLEERNTDFWRLIEVGDPISRPTLIRYRVCFYCV